MNTLSATLGRSKFRHYPHLVVQLDDAPLEAVVAGATGDDIHAGLVSALDRWITDEAERRVVWERILPTPDGAAIAPVLVCPDHGSLRCMVIVAEVIAGDGLVEWARIGIDRSDPREAGEVGTSVEWFAGLGPLRYQRAAYADFLTMCKLAHSSDVLQRYAFGERNFQEADLTKVVLPGADLREARFDDASFWEADLSGANLRQAALRSAKMFKVKLGGADLRGADLENSGLTLADLTGAEIVAARVC